MEGSGSDYIGANSQLANLGQNSSWMEGTGTGSGRLMLTLCKSDARGSYHHAMIPLPKSYEAAVSEASQVFESYMDYEFRASDIVLKCAMKRANGTEAWGILRPADWRSLIRPDGDEVGVFLRQDSLDLPYEPSQKAGNQKSEVQEPQHNDPTSSTSGAQLESKIMYLIFKSGSFRIVTSGSPWGQVFPGSEKSTMIKVPVTYQACQAAAYNAFKNSENFDHKTPNDVILQIERKKQEASSWSVVTPEAYSVLLSTYGDPIDLYVK